MKYTCMGRLQPLNKVQHSLFVVQLWEFERITLSNKTVHTSHRFVSSVLSLRLAPNYNNSSLINLW